MWHLQRYWASALIHVYALGGHACMRVHVCAWKSNDTNAAVLKFLHSHGIIEFQCKFRCILLNCNLLTGPGQTRIVLHDHSGEFDPAHILRHGAEVQDPFLVQTRILQGPEVHSHSFLAIPEQNHRHCKIKHSAFMRLKCLSLSLMDVEPNGWNMLQANATASLTYILILSKDQISISIHQQGTHEVKGQLKCCNLRNIQLVCSC